MPKLLPDTAVPALDLPLVGGGRFTLADQTPENFTMIVVYRGYHCPVCKSYLQGLSEIMDDYKEAGFSVVAVSMNDEQVAEKTVKDWDIANIPVAHSLTIEQAQDWDLWLSKAITDAEAEYFAEPGLFWVRPDGRLYLADISNMPFARPDLASLLSKVDFITGKDYPARGTYVA